MTYPRVIPRDLFNEGNLLKCYGQVYLELERLLGDADTLVHSFDDEHFDVYQIPADGSLTVRNVFIYVRGAPYGFKRPLNDRREYPLYLATGSEDIAVFTEYGKFTDEMRSFIVGTQGEP